MIYSKKAAGLSKQKYRRQEPKNEETKWNAL